MKLLLTLYVAGDSPAAARALASLRALGSLLGNGEVRVDVVDVLHDPHRAEEARILATPTVVRESPLPRRRITGDLSDLQRVCAALGLDPQLPHETHDP